MSLEAGEARGMLLQRMYSWPDRGDKKQNSAKDLLNQMLSELQTGDMDPLLVIHLGMAIFSVLDYKEVNSFVAPLVTDLSDEVNVVEKFKLESGGKVKLNHTRSIIDPQVAYFLELGEMEPLPSEEEVDDYFPSFGALEIFSILGELKGGLLLKNS